MVVVVVVVIVVIIITGKISSSSSHYPSVMTASRIAWKFISLPSVYPCDLMVVHMDIHILR
jgi:hypothetical protein